MDQPKSLGLAALAQAAVMACCDPPQEPSEPFSPRTVLGKNASLPRDPSPVSSKRPRREYSLSPTPGPDLAPIRLSSPADSSFFTPQVPDFGLMPPMSQITSLAGSGCTCGVECACPGCVVHRGPEHTSSRHKDCGEGCGTCVDRSTEMSLSSPGTMSHSILDQFFARAAALPLPPTHGTQGRGPNRQEIAVSLPKLECCGDVCGCSGGQCTCRVSNGCCAGVLRPTATPPPPPLVKSCCQRS